MFVYVLLLVYNFSRLIKVFINKLFKKHFALLLSFWVYERSMFDLMKGTSMLYGGQDSREAKMKVNLSISSVKMELPRTH